MMSMDIAGDQLSTFSITCNRALVLVFGVLLKFFYHGVFGKNYFCEFIFLFSLFLLIFIVLLIIHEFYGIISNRP